MTVVLRLALRGLTVSQWTVDTNSDGCVRRRTVTLLKGFLLANTYGSRQFPVAPVIVASLTGVTNHTCHNGPHHYCSSPSHAIWRGTSHNTIPHSSICKSESKYFRGGGRRFARNGC